MDKVTLHVYELNVQYLSKILINKHSSGCKIGCKKNCDHTLMDFCINVPSCQHKWYTVQA